MRVVPPHRAEIRQYGSRMPAVVVAIAFVVGGCGTSDGAAGYVGRASNAVEYVSWTRSGNTLTGQLTEARTADDSDGTVTPQRMSFTGTVSGPAVSLRLEQGLGTSSTLTGSLHGD